MKLVRTYMRTVGLALLLTGCGASSHQYSDSELSPGSEVVIPPNVLRSPPALLSSAMVELIPDSDSRIYETLVTIHHGSTRIRSVKAKQDWVGAMRQARVVNPVKYVGCQASECNYLILPAGLPLEATRWLSVADHHWRSGKEPILEHQSIAALGPSRTPVRDGYQVIRQTMHFSPNESVRCTARRKHFSDRIRDFENPVDVLVAETQKRDGIQHRDWPVPEPTNDTGHFFSRQRIDASGKYRMEIHWSASADSTHNGEAMDWSLVCMSNAPLRSGDLGLFDQRFVKTSKQYAMVTQFKPGR